jgi:tetraacyldisaccharide 4'-kinase
LRRTVPQTAGAPVVCIGNLVAGGAGKTPTAICVMEMLAARGLAVHALSRGHGGTVRGPHRVDPRRDTAMAVGDEPLLLAAFAPTWVARDRVAGARAAVEAGAQVVVMDDGFQNPALAKTLSLLVVDAAQGFGNGRCIPAGPLRETVAEGLARADAVVLIGSADDAGRTMARWPALSALPVLRGRLEPLATGLPLADADVVAFAGIGRPEKFFATLRASGAKVLAAHAFPDHAAYAPKVLRRLLAEARARDAMLVTTEKDAVRLPPAFRAEVMALPVRLRLEEPAALAALLDRLERCPT